MARRSGLGVADVQRIGRLEIRQDTVKDEAGNRHQYFQVAFTPLQQEKDHIIHNAASGHTLTKALTELGERLAETYEEELAQAVSDRDAAAKPKRRA